MTLRIITPPAVPNVSGVYAIRCRPTGKVYVGSAILIARRWRGHRESLRRGKHHSDHLQRAWNKYGEGAFHFEVLETAPKEDLIVAEQRCIDEMRACDWSRGFNIAPRAANTLGAKLPPFTQEHRAKIGAALKGKRHSKEHKASNAAARKGVTLSLGHRANIGASIKGKIRSEETRAKMRLAQKGKVFSALARARAAEACRKLSDAQVSIVRQRLLEQVSYGRIAGEVGCSKQVICDIKLSRTGIYK
jgi:group I intron endonuclease